MTSWDKLCEHLTQQLGQSPAQRALLASSQSRYKELAEATPPNLHWMLILSLPTANPCCSATQDRRKPSPDKVEGVDLVPGELSPSTAKPSGAVMGQS